MRQSCRRGPSEWTVHTRRGSPALCTSPMAHDDDHSLSLSLSQSLSHSHSLTLTLTLPLSHSFSHSHTHTLSLSLSLTLTLSSCGLTSLFRGHRGARKKGANQLAGETVGSMGGRSHRGGAWQKREVLSPVSVPFPLQTILQVLRAPCSLGPWECRTHRCMTKTYVTMTASVSSSASCRQLGQISVWHGRVAGT